MNLGVQQRFGVGEKCEIQCNLDTSIFLSFVPLSTPIPFPFMYLDLGIKFVPFSNEQGSFSLIPYTGYYGGFALIRGLFGPTIGLKMIGSMKIKDNHSFYGGVNFIFARDIIGFFIGTDYNLFPYFDFDGGFIFGWELKGKFISRHEIYIGCFLFMYETPFLTFSYNFAFGGQYLKNKKLYKK